MSNLFNSLANYLCFFFGTRDLEVPKTWEASSDIVQFKNLSDNRIVSDSSGAASDSRSYVANSKVSESLLLMKFYEL